MIKLSVSACFHFVGLMPSASRPSALILSLESSSNFFSTSGISREGGLLSGVAGVARLSAEVATKGLAAGRARGVTAGAAGRAKGVAAGVPGIITRGRGVIAGTPGRGVAAGAWACAASGQSERAASTARARRRSGRVDMIFLGVRLELFLERIQIEKRGAESLIQRRVEACPFGHRLQEQRELVLVRGADEAHES